MKLNSNQRRRARRKRLYDKQRGACHFCGRTMTLPGGPPIRGEATPEAQANLYHLNSRYDGDDGKRPDSGETVCVCRACCDERSKRRESMQPKADLRQRSGRPEVSPKLYMTEPGAQS